MVKGILTAFLGFWGRGCRPEGLWMAILVYILNQIVKIEGRTTQTMPAIMN